MSVYSMLLHNSSQSFDLSIDCGRAQTWTGTVARASAKMPKGKRAKLPLYFPAKDSTSVTWWIGYNAPKRDCCCGNEQWNMSFSVLESGEAALQYRQSDTLLECFWTKIGFFCCFFKLLNHWFEHRLGTATISKLGTDITLNLIGTPS